MCDEYILDNFYLDQLSSPDCWLAAVTDINIPNMQLQLVLDGASIIEMNGDAGELEGDIAELVNNALLLVMGGFGDLTTNLINGLVQGPLRTELMTFFGKVVLVLLLLVTVLMVVGGTFKETMNFEFKGLVGIN
jgi:hypothetical protein